MAGSIRKAEKRKLPAMVKKMGFIYFFLENPKNKRKIKHQL